MTGERDPLELFEIRSFTPYLLNMAAERTSEAFSDVYKRQYGMKRTEWRVLFHLGRYGPMSAHEIGARARVHKTKISRAVRDLETKRFVRR
ncbi:MarR family transcriptional regulator [Rhodobacterales bacterium]|nr:MarR family transcriptional regulator [Rhodobacterales bacterium]